MLSNQARRLFYGANISRKAGQKCCPFGQNGKPLSQEKVDEFLSQYRDSKVWIANDDRTVLTRQYYLKNIFCAVEFVKDLYEMDSHSKTVCYIYIQNSLTTKQIPNVHILDQDIVKVELHTSKLKGLSYRDLELASIIDGFDLEKYKLVPIDQEGKGDVKRVIRKIKVDEQAKQFENTQILIANTKCEIMIFDLGVQELLINEETGNVLINRHVLFDLLIKQEIEREYLYLATL